MVSLLVLNWSLEDSKKLIPRFSHQGPVRNTRSTNGTKRRPRDAGGGPVSSVMLGNENDQVGREENAAVEESPCGEEIDARALKHRSWCSFCVKGERQRMAPRRMEKDDEREREGGRGVFGCCFFDVFEFLGEGRGGGLILFWRERREGGRNFFGCFMGLGGVSCFCFGWGSFMPGGGP